MSTVELLEPPSVKLDVKPSSNSNNNKNISNKGANHPKRKNKHDRGTRKRSKSFSGCGIPLNPKPVLPTKFLLGGNINDPLNLNSLQDEDINRAMNAVTPKSSPVPTPPRRKGLIEVMIPPNMPDPLHLIDCENDEEYEQTLCSPVKKGRKKRLKKRRTISTCTDLGDAEISGNSEARTPEASTDSAKIPDDPIEVKPKPCKNLTIDLGKEKKDRPKRKSEEFVHAAKKFKNSMDKIVSPVVPQPGAWLKRSNSVNKWAKPRQNKVQDEQMPVFKEKDKKFQYGNYNRYYGYRNPNNEIDHRLKVFWHHPYLFDNKDILDIGCNIGHITLSIARDFGARSITGIDIDPKLINIARKNVKHYVKTSENSPRPEATTDVNNRQRSSRFNDAHQRRSFPNNVTFKQCNYVLDDENLLALEQPQFDMILCLSVTKWIHLNWGDNGIKLTFRRMYEQLRPGGKLILEPQNWASYKNKKKLTATIYKNYNSIEFFPDKFREYLLSPAVGFAKSEILAYPQAKSAGFRRPLQVFTKSTMFPSERIEATPSNPISSGSYRGLTDRYESQNSNELNVEHVYTDLLESRYCECSEDAVELNKRIGESLNEETRNLDFEANPDNSKDSVVEGIPTNKPNGSCETEPCSDRYNSIVDNT